MVLLMERGDACQRSDSPKAPPPAHVVPVEVPLLHLSPPDGGNYGIDIQIRDVVLFAERACIAVDRIYRDEGESGPAPTRSGCGRGREANSLRVAPRVALMGKDHHRANPMSPVHADDGAGRGRSIVNTQPAPGRLRT